MVLSDNEIVVEQACKTIGLLPFWWPLYLPFGSQRNLYYPISQEGSKEI